MSVCALLEVLGNQKMQTHWQTVQTLIRSFLIWFYSALHLCIPGNLSVCPLMSKCSRVLKTFQNQEMAFSKSYHHLVFCCHSRVVTQQTLNSLQIHVGMKIKYRQVPKFLNARKLCFNLSKIQTKMPNLRIFCQKDANGIANSEDPDQTAPLGAV